MRKLKLISLFFALVSLTNCGIGLNYRASALSSGLLPITVYGMKGTINGAVVTMYSLADNGDQDKVLGSCSIAAATCEITSDPGSSAMEFELSGGTYYDEATGLTVPLGTFKMRTRLTAVPPSRRVAISALTEMAVQRAKQLAGSLKDQIDAANSDIATAFNLTDITSVSSDATLAPTDQTSNDAKYGLVLSAMSQYAKNVGASTTDLVSALVTDFAFDGNINGTGEAGTVEIPLTDGGTATPSVTELASSTADFIANPLNPGFTEESNPLEDDAHLSDLSLSSGSLTPSFSADTLWYSVSIDSSIASLTVTAPVVYTGATVTVNGTTVNSGTASSALSMSVGTNTVTVVVTSNNESSTKTYTLSIVRAAAENHAPSTPTSISCATSPVAASTGNACTLTAASPTDADSDTVTYADASSTCTGVAVNSSTGNATFTAPAKGATCLVKVRAYDGTDYSSAVTSSTITGANNSPTTPTSISCATSPVGSSTGNACTLMAASPTDPDGDTVSYSDSSSTCSSVVVNSSTGNATFTAPANGASCLVKVKAYDGTAYSGTVTSSTITGTAASANNSPSTPTSISCTTSPTAASTGNACTLTAASPTDPDGDTGSYSDSSSTCTSVVVNSSTGNATFTAPAKGATCLVKVRAYDGTAYSGTVTSSTITGANNSPSTPTSIACTTSPTAASTGNACTLTAASPTDPDGDTVSYSDSSSTCTSVVVNSSTGNATYTAPALSATCLVKVKSYDGTAYSGTVTSSTITGAVASANTAPTTPTAIQCMTAPYPASTGNGCTLTAASPTDPEGDTVSYADAASTCAGVVVNSSTGNATFTAPGLGATCLVKVKAYDGALYSSAVTSATITGTNGCNIAFAGGAGTSGDPYLVSTAAQMDSIGTSSCLWDKYFKLTANISLSAYTGTQFHGGFDFSGDFDGNSKTISDFSSTNATIGLYGYSLGSVHDLTLSNVNLVGNGGGAIASSLGGGGSISNVYVSGTVAGVSNVGCIVGNMRGNSTMSRSHASCAVVGAAGSSYLGGLVGLLGEFPSITNSYFTGSVVGDYGLGGISGTTRDNSGTFGSVNYSYSTGSVTSLTSSTDVGGLIGDVDGYSGTVTGGGMGNDVAPHSFWDTQTSGRAMSASGGNGLSTSLMKTAINYTGAGWDNTYVWNIVDGSYPTLRTAAQMPVPKYFNNSAAPGGTLPHWNTLANWFTNSACTTAASSIPQTGEAVYLKGAVAPDTGPSAALTVARFDTSGLSQALDSSAGTVTSNVNIAAGGALLMGVAGNATYIQKWYGTMANSTPTATFQGVSENYATIKGNAVFNDSSSSIGSPSSYGIVEGYALFNDLSHTEIFTDGYGVSYYVHCNGGVGLAFGGGSGTAGDPFLISTAAQMRSIGTAPCSWSKYFKLTQNISLADYTGRQFRLISGFSGIFDGNSKTISNFSYSDTSDAQVVGLYGYSEGNIHDLALTNVNVVGGHDVGAIAGGSGGTMSNVYVSGTVTGTDYVGCVVGALRGSWGVINKARASCTVSGSNTVGGILGWISAYGSLSNSYFTGAVSGYQSIGGLVGYLHDDGSNCATLANCYSTGTVTFTGGGTTGRGGLVGANESGTAGSGSFWDTETSGVATTSGGGTGKTTAQMKTTATFTGASWNSTTIWKLGAGVYPTLFDSYNFYSTCAQIPDQNMCAASALSCTWSSGACQ